MNKLCAYPKLFFTINVILALGRNTHQQLVKSINKLYQTAFRLALALLHDC